MTLTVALLTLTISSADAEAKKLRSDHHDWFQSIISELDLSKDQISKIKAIRSASKEAMETQREALRTIRNELATAMAGSTDDSTLRRTFEKKQVIKKELGNARFEMALKVRAVLDGEQRKKFYELKKKHRKKFKKMRRSKKHGDHSTDE